MIRFKVVRASRVLLFVAAAILVAVLCLVGARWALERREPSAAANAQLIQARPGAARALSAFAPGGGGIVVERVTPTPVPTPTPAPTARPSVLIYHTHTHEAYEQVSDDPYDAVEAWRTTDAGHSVVRVGEELARCLREAGFEVVHDATDHEGDALSTAYTRSLATLEGYERPFDLYIDLHRDAWIRGMELRYVCEDGERCAQPMLLIGNGNGFDVKPHTEENLAFARELTRNVNRLQPGLCKDVLVKDGRYNQHIGVFSVLIEVGHNKNTLREALNTVPILARAIRQTFDAPGPELKRIMEKS